MPIDPSIPLQAQPVQVPNLLNSAAQLMGLRNSVTEQALRQAQIQQANAVTADTQAQAQQRARDVADNNTIQEAMGDSAKYKAIAQGDYSSILGKVAPSAIDSLETKRLAFIDKKLTQSKESNENEQSARTAIANGIDGLLQFKNPDGTTNFDAINDQLQNFISGHAENFRTLGIDPSTMGAQQITDEKGLNAFKSHLGVEHELTQIALERQKEQAAIAASGATAANETAQGKKADTDREEKQLIIDQVKKSLTPQAGQHPVDAVLDPKVDPQANVSFKAEYDNTPLSFGDNPNAGKEAVLQRAAAHAAALSPTSRQKKVDDAVSVQTAVERAKAAMAPGVLGAIADPAVRSEVMRQADKAENDYATKAGDADRLLAGVQAARSGNQAAASMLTMQEVRSIVSRVTQQEVAQAGGASVARRVDNAFSKGWDGVPSEATLKDLEDFANVSKKAAANTRTNALGTLDKNYGSKFGAVGASSTTNPDSNTTIHPDVAAILKDQKPGRYTLSDGSKYTKKSDGEVVPQ